MDVTIYGNLTPKEARELMGLADLRPLQEEALTRIRRSVMAQAENISADGLLKAWFMGSSSAFDILGDVTQGDAVRQAQGDQSSGGTFIPSGTATGSDVASNMNLRKFVPTARSGDTMKIVSPRGRQLF